VAIWHSLRDACATSPPHVDHHQRRESTTRTSPSRPPSSSNVHGSGAARTAVRHDLEQMLFDYLHAAGIGDAGKDTPLFPAASRKPGTLTAEAMYGVDVYRMVKRRLKEAGLESRLSPHSFRVTTIDLLEQGVPSRTSSAWPATPTRAPL
jgi:hypothetical protein